MGVSGFDKCYFVSYFSENNWFEEEIIEFDIEYWK